MGYIGIAQELLNIPQECLLQGQLPERPLQPLQIVLLNDPPPQRDSQQVHAENIEHHVVPPALIEVGQQVPEHHLKQLEDHALEEHKFEVAADEGLDEPADNVGEYEDVEGVLDVFEGL